MKSDSYRNMTGDLIITTLVDRLEHEDMSRQVFEHLTRRFVDAIYAELLPTIREHVIKALDAGTIARHIEAEIQQAVAAALKGSQ